MVTKYSFGEKGQDLVEFAIIFPFLFLILVGIFDLGRSVYYISVLNNIAREGARAGIIYPVDQNNIKNAVCKLAIGVDIGCPNPSITVIGLDESDNTVPLDFSGEDPIRIKVGVSYDFHPVTPVIGKLLGLGEGDSITLNSQATMRIEY